VFLLWRLTPPHLIPWQRGPGTKHDTHDKGGSTGLRLVEPSTHNEPPAQ